MTKKPELWELMRTWLSKQKHINTRVNIEALEHGPPFAEICTVGNRYTWADIFEDHVKFYTEILTTSETGAQRREEVLMVHATDKLFFKKVKEQLLKMLYAGNLNWPSYMGYHSRHSPPNVW